VRYSNTFTYSRYKRTLQLSNGPRLKDSMRQFMTSLSVEAYDLKVVKPQADEALSSMLSSSQWGGLGAAVCQSPRPWGPDPQQAAAGGGGGGSTTHGGLPTSTSFKRSGLGPVSHSVHTYLRSKALQHASQAAPQDSRHNSGTALP
jgi:hypothetical protein